MRVFVCEWVTGGGFAGQALPGGLLREGELMLRALVRDLADADAEVVVARDARLPVTGLPGEVVGVAGGVEPWDAWERAIAAADAVWPVAPETGGALLRLTELAAASGRVLLGSGAEAVRLCGSKLATVERLEACGVVAVPTGWLGAGVPETAAGWVVKPDDGAGAESAVLVEGRGALAGMAGEGLVVQPYLPGEAVSLSLLCRGGEAVLLACNQQRVGLDPPGVPGGPRGFRYEGWVVGGAEARRRAYEPLAAAIARAVPGLWGYAGVDLIETSSGPVVLEVNPRLTTTYAGLREATGQNPAALVLGLAGGGALPPGCEPGFRGPAVVIGA